MPGRAQAAVMSALSITNLAPSERQLTGGILFLLAGLAALGALATNIILPAFPRIGVSLGVSSQELGLTLSSFFVAFAFGQLLVGPLSDRFGRKWLVLGGLAVFVAGSVLCAFADTLSFLVFGRVIQALGACAASVLSRAIARDLFEGEALTRALALTMIVLAAGVLAPRLAHRWGQRTVGMIGLFIALAGGLYMFAFAAAPAFMTFTTAIALYLLGMGLINPLGTAIALHPFGRQAGLASALLGFLQMGCAAIGASFASVLPLQPSASLAVILTTGSALALLVFLPVALRRPRAEPSDSGGVPESTGG